MIATIDIEKTIHIYDSKTYQCLHELKGCILEIQMLKWSHDSSMIVSNGNEEEHTYQ